VGGNQFYPKIFVLQDIFDITNTDFEQADPRDFFVLMPLQVFHCSDGILPDYLFRFKLNYIHVHMPNF